MLTILATGDLHIGRRPSRVANHIQGQNLSCARMWESIVDRAIAENVNMVALSGDVVDHDNRFFEATGPLERGINRLAENGIHTFSVAGNHDYDVFPRIIRDLDPQFFHFLGAGGRWQSFDFEIDGKLAARLHGWSIPSSHFETSPFAEYRLPSHDEVPTIGLMHADLDVPGSPYAPISGHELQATEATIWILGHIHTPRYLSGRPGPNVLYPGSPQAMDPGETGDHGPWLLEFDGPHLIDARQLPMSRVLYHELAIDLTGLSEIAEVESKIQASISAFIDGLANNEYLEHAVLRVRFVGQTSLCAHLDPVADRLSADLDLSPGRVSAHIDRVINDTVPEADLRELATKHDPPGHLAKLLLQLREGDIDENGQKLLEVASRRICDVHQSGTYVQVRSDRSPGPDDTKEYALRAGMLLLGKLRSQRTQ